jgi:3-dehydroquinate synthase
MHTEQLTVGLGERSYPILIGSGILGRVGEELSRLAFPRRIAVISNPTVATLFGEKLLGSLTAAGFQTELISIGDGEEFKSLQTLEEIFGELIRRGFDRGSGMLALGGGVVGDITGFAAATYLRGVPFVQVPTTLLAQVDSSVGGKTAVNHPLGKNLIGAFYQPRLVHIDVATLETLPQREFAAGLAEVVKYGVIADREFFQWLSRERQSVMAQVPEVLVSLVKRSCQIKANVVESDEKEHSLRAILNFGHTYGHAVETLSGYGKVRHGEAVALGMLVAASCAAELGLCRTEEIAAIRDLLQAFRLPVRLPDLPLDAVLEVMARDKKVKNGVLRLILNRGLGGCEIRDIAEPRPLLHAALARLEGL